MPDQEFHLEVTDQSVCARLKVSGKTRFYALAFSAGFTVLLTCVLLFAPGKQGRPSSWHDRTTSYFLLLSFPLSVVLLTGRYVRLAYPSDEVFRADRSSLSISRVRWLDVHNKRWEERHFPLAEVREIRYRSLARLRGASIYGLLFISDGEKCRVLPGLKPDDAEQILLALKSFGANVPDNPVVPNKLKKNQSPN